MSKRHRLSGYLAFHSFGNKILYPWGYTNNPTSDVQDLRGLAKVAQSAISNSFAQRRSFADLLFSDPSMEKYDVAQVSIREAPPKKDKKPQKTIGNSLRRIIFGDGIDNEISQTEGDYEYGQPQNIIYRVTGGSDDWARGGAGIK